MAGVESSALWRKLAYLGSRYGPRWWLEFSPGPIGLSVSLAAPEARGRLQRRLRGALQSDSEAALRLASARAFAQYAHCLAESLAAGRPEANQARCRFKDPELASALECPGGLVIATAHAGAWDAAAPLIARDLRRGVTIVMRPEASRAAQALHDDVRRRAGVEIVHVGRDPTDALPLLKRLQSGGVVAFQMDRVPSGVRALDVRLFGRPSQVPEGPFRIAGLAQVPVIPLFVRRVGHFHYELWGGPSLRVSRRPSPSELARAGERAAWELERFLRAHPTQWFCFDGQ